MGGRGLIGRSDDMSDVKKTKRRPPEQRVADVLKKATPDAAQFLVESLGDEGLTFSQRMDCAKEILNRVIGKTAPEAEQAGDVVFVLEGTLEEYAG